MAKMFSVKNFDRFQHYRDRCPPWIKLYRELLDDYQFTNLPENARLHLILIWLLASRFSGPLPYDPEWVGRRINSDSEVDLDILVKSEFLVIAEGDASVLASPANDASAEREEETEKEVEAEADFEDFWNGYPKRPNVSKKKTLAEWKRLTPQKKLSALASLKPFREQLAKDKTEPRFIVHPERYLRDERFEGFADVAAERVRDNVVSMEAVRRRDAIVAAALAPKAIVTPEERERVAARFAELSQNLGTSE